MKWPKLIAASLSISAFLFAGAALTNPSQALAATYTVTKTADTNDGTCDADCSLREAIAAAKLNPGPDNVHFAIPTSDPNWNTEDFPNAFRIRFTSNGRLSIFDSDITIDATTQENVTGDNHIANFTDYENATTGPEIIIDLSTYTGSNYPILINGDNIIFKGFGLYNNQINKRRALELRQEGSTSLNVVIEDNDFVNNAEGGLRTVNGAFQDLIIRNNVFRSNGLNFTDFDGAEMTISSNVTIQNNYFVSNGASGLSLELNASLLSNVDIQGNTFYKNGMNTLNHPLPGLIATGGPVLSGSKINLSHNTFNQNAANGILVYGDVNGISIQNNTFFGNQLQEIDLSVLSANGDGKTPNVYSKSSSRTK